MKPIAWRDANNEVITPANILRDYPALIRFFDLKDEGLFYIPSASRSTVINWIKCQEKPQERLRCLKGIIDEPGGELTSVTAYKQGTRAGYKDVWRLKPQDYLSVGAHLTAEDLVEFLDDPSDIVRDHCVRFLPTGVQKKHNIVIPENQISFLFDEEQLKKAG